MTFFSGTDLNTLKEEGNDTNHFVSLIVNNAGTYTAAITRKIKSISTGESTVEYNTFDNELVVGESSRFEKETFYIEYYNLEVQVEELPIIPKSELELRLEEVRKNSNSYINRKTFTSPIASTFPQSKSSDTTQDVFPTKEKYVQQSLFTPSEMGEKPSKEDFLYDDLEAPIAYDEDHVNPEIVNRTILQIITGDIFSVYKSNIELDKWVSNMPVLYNKRFGSLEVEELNAIFGLWADSFVEFLELEVEDALEEKGRDYLDAIWAYDVITVLQDYPENPYLNVFIETLKRWLV